MKYKYVDETNTVVHEIQEDGSSKRSYSIDDQDYVKWLSEGNTPEPADVYVETNLDKIQKLESSITQRRLRDAVLTEDGKLWLTNIEQEIDLLRKGL